MSPPASGPRGGSSLARSTRTRSPRLERSSIRSGADARRPRSSYRGHGERSGECCHLGPPPRVATSSPMLGFERGLQGVPLFAGVAVVPGLVGRDCRNALRPGSAPTARRRPRSDHTEGSDGARRGRGRAAVVNEGCTGRRSGGRGRDVESARVSGRCLGDRRGLLVAMTGEQWSADESTSMSCMTGSASMSSGVPGHHSRLGATRCRCGSCQ